jgi:hypothetical protein
MTRTTPSRLMTRQNSHIGFTDGFTFIVHTPHDKSFGIQGFSNSQIQILELQILKARHYL